MEVFKILKRGTRIDVTEESTKLYEFSSDELNYAYRTRETARDGSPAIGDYRAMGRTIFSKRVIVKALEERNMRQIRSISRHFYSVSGIYARACKYMAYLPTYDFLVTPYIQNKKTKKDTVNKDLASALMMLEDMNLKTRLGEISLNVLIEGVYYGYVKSYLGKLVIQDLPTEYCRSIYKVNGFPVVELNLDYIDREFHNEAIKKQVLDTLPPEVKDMYVRVKKGEQIPANLKGEHWVKLEIGSAIKFSLNRDDAPLFSAAIPEIIDLDDLRGIQKKKAESQLLKIMVQKIPLDKNGDFIFDMEEAKAMHANAVRMLARAVNVDVLTTFADSDLLDLEEKRGSATIEVENWERATFSELGISAQLFATDGNLALEKSIANDESIMMQLVKSYQDWLNFILKLKFQSSIENYVFNIFFPRITQHNRNEISKLYKEQASMGYSKLLPAIALGQSQLNLISTLVFEKDYLNISDYMEPLKMSSTQSGKDGAGRPEKAPDQKSDKTLANEAAGG